MADLTREDVLKLARLARLQITEEEVGAFQKELNEVLEYVKHLDSVDVDGLEPTSQVTGLTNVMREDEVIDYGIAPQTLLALAPKKQDGHIKVRRMIG
jgi:aspartyl-tRNA(Asn)/glutamyl-tRNA(Gln) amidotransferase subunit C